MTAARTGDVRAADRYQEYVDSLDAEYELPPDIDLDDVARCRALVLSAIAALTSYKLDVWLADTAEARDALSGGYEWSNDALLEQMQASMRS